MLKVSKELTLNNITIADIDKKNNTILDLVARNKETRDDLLKVYNHAKESLDLLKESIDIQKRLSTTIKEIKLLIEANCEDVKKLNMIKSAIYQMENY